MIQMGKKQMREKEKGSFSLKPVEVIFDKTNSKLFD